MNLSDAELVRAIAGGDRLAFAAFYDRHVRGVYGLLLKMFPVHADADDVLQETFLQVWQQAKRFDAERSSPFGWVVMMARSRALDRMRKRSEVPKSDLPDRLVLFEADDPLTRTETAEGVHSALARLSAEQRSAIALAYFGGLTYDQVATRQAIPVGTAKTRIRLGLQKLRQLLESSEGRHS